MCVEKRTSTKKGRQGMFLKVFWAAFPHFCLISSLVIYAALGAMMFQFIEQKSENNSLATVDKLLQKLWMACINVSSCKENASKEEKEIFLRQTNSTIYFELHPRYHLKSWSFLRSLFFCCTVFTTIGYGDMYPTTLPGKIVCIIYATFGIPLMLLVMTDVGDLLAVLLSKTFKKTKRQFKKRFSSSSPSPSPSTVLSPLQPPPSKTSRWSSFKIRIKDKEHQTISSSKPNIVIREPLNITDVLKSQSSVKKRSLHLRNAEIFNKIIAKENMNFAPFQFNKLERSMSCPDLKSITCKFPQIGEELDKLDVPVGLVIFVILAFIMLAALILKQWETQWDYSDSVYFYFITLTTIGFGDIVPSHPNFFLLTSLFIIVGMAVMSMAFKLVQNRIVCGYKAIISFISGGKVKEYENM
ncbi:potassium channel subfamily K member 18 [Protopterus annectens]|uniref:potassium channel subfamily K member 18 n=1 Tax=Protopterus annectens TaxID=7888 RepID=UPI001CFB8E32|nr:potassium channel subfamily K member 18 [Protopterus annectens]